MNLDLFDPVSRVPLVGPSYEKKLERLGITKVEELLTHIPRRYLDFRKSAKISELHPGDIVYLKGEVVSSISQYTKRGGKIQITQITDGEESVMAIWFNQPFLSRILYPGVKLSIAGEVGWFNRKLAFLSPQYEKLDNDLKSLHTQGLVPLYPETAGVTSKWLRRKITDTLVNLEVPEFLPKEILTKYKLLEYKEALQKIHAPQDDLDIKNAHRRLAFNELLALQIKNIKNKKAKGQIKVAYEFRLDENKINQFIENLPFKLTSSQTKAIDEIKTDLIKNTPMNLSWCQENTFSTV